MNWKAIGIGVAIVVAGGITEAQLPWIAAGSATVDGVLSPAEWTNANWVRMDEVYYGTPLDLSNAMWAALWDAQDNAIYLAVTGTDTDHVMRAYSGWDQQDDIEVYINARNDGVSDYDTNMFAYAQQYVVGYNQDSASLWAMLGGSSNLPPGTIPESSFGIVSNQVVYELKLKPYDHYDFYNATNSTLVSLHAGLVIRLDVVMSTRTQSGVFGMLCANQMANKWRYSANMQDYRLARPLVHASVIMLR